MKSAVAALLMLASLHLLSGGVIGLVGWANRLLVVLNCVWVMSVAWHAIALHDPKHAGLRAQAPRGVAEI